jgi:ribosomal protein S18 acetylase RimI-like enzyme
MSSTAMSSIAMSSIAMSSAAMPALALDSSPLVRPGVPADLDALLALECAVFATDRLSRRSFRHFMAAPRAALIVAAEGGRLAGYALILFRPRSAIARLYSIAVVPAHAGRGIGPMLLAAAESAARRRDCSTLRLEVHEDNATAIRRYRKSGYHLFGRHLGYYDDRGNALRFEKPLAASSTAAKISASPAAPVAR